jgi:hypothetical protein
MLKLTTPAGGQNETQLGGMPAEALTRMLLGELITERKA